MTRVKLLSAALISAGALAVPAAAKTHVVRRHVLHEAHIAAAARSIDGRACVPAPRVGAFASQPWDNATPCEPVRSY